MVWFEFGQNNSGGSFDVDGQVCHRLFIEAENVDEAVQKAESLGCYWDGVENGMDCPCCGDRWSQPWGSEGLEFPFEYDPKNGLIFENVEEYAQYLANEYGWTSPDARLFKADGTVLEIFSNKVKGKRKKK